MNGHIHVGYVLGGHAKAVIEVHRSPFIGGGGRRERPGRPPGRPRSSRGREKQGVPCTAHLMGACCEMQTPLQLRRAAQRPGKATGNLVNVGFSRRQARHRASCLDRSRKPVDGQGVSRPRKEATFGQEIRLRRIYAGHCDQLATASNTSRPCVQAQGHFAGQQRRHTRH